MFKKYQFIARSVVLYIFSQIVAYLLSYARRHLCPLPVNTHFTSLLSGGTAIKLGINIHHRSGHCGKGFKVHDHSY